MACLLSRNNTLPKTKMKHTFEEIRQGCIEGIEEEIEAVIANLARWGGDKPVEIVGAEIDSVDGEYTIYRVQVKREIIPPENVGVEVSSGDKQIRGYVDSVVDPYTFYIALESAMTEGELRQGIISFDATYILQAVKNRLAAIVPIDKTKSGLTALDRILGLEPAHVGSAYVENPALVERGLNESQLRAIAQCVGSNLCVVFGPPGTGKTRTLGGLVSTLAGPLGKRVLVTAHTNLALDTAMASVVDSVPQEWVDQGKIVRSGKISKQFAHLGIGYDDIAKKSAPVRAAELRVLRRELEERANLLLSNVGSGRITADLIRRGAKRRNREPSLRAWMADMERKIGLLRPKQRQEEEVQRLIADYELFKRQVAQATREIEKGARIVGATLSKLALEPDTFDQFDAVVLDEASMAMLPQVMVAALHSTDQVIVFGDPCQLPPVVQSRGPKATAWLRRNVYRQLEAEDPATTKPFVVMLEEQYRMRPEIREFVSETFYAGRLRDADVVKNRPTVSGPSVIFFDTSAIGATAEKSGDHSRVNPVHAEQVALMIDELQRFGETDIAVVTPFANQAKLIRAALREMRIPMHGIHIGTVHRTQGGERDVVIVDFTDAPPSMSMFLDDSWNKDLSNLLCVALSRARQRLIVVAHAQGFRAKYGYSDRLIIRILEKAARLALNNNAYIRYEGIPPERDPLAPALHGMNHAAPALVHPRSMQRMRRIA